MANTYICFISRSCCPQPTLSGDLPRVANADMAVLCRRDTLDLNLIHALAGVPPRPNRGNRGWVTHTNGDCRVFESSKDGMWRGLWVTKGPLSKFRTGQTLYPIKG